MGGCPFCGKSDTVSNGVYGEFGAQPMKLQLASVYGEFGPPRTFGRKAGDVVAPPESNPVRKFFNAEKQTRSGAIKAMCAHCMGCTIEATEQGFRSSIRDCSSGPTSAAPCPLWKFRPFRSKDDSEDAE